MSIANSATCDTACRAAPLAAVANRPAAGLMQRREIRAYLLPVICRPVSRLSDAAAGWQVREEEGEYDLPDLVTDRNYEPDPALFDAAEAHTEAQRKAMALLNDAENLLAVLLASVEHVGDSRARQVEAVATVVIKKLRKAYNRIDRQDTRHRNLFLAYFELKAQSDEGAE